MIDLGELLRRIVKYLVEGIMVQVPILTKKIIKLR